MTNMEIAIISGKGGTGKSSISAAFATMAERVILADCDVDAANLYLLFNPSHEEEVVYTGSLNAVINDSLCTNCGLCMEYCRFDAISMVNNKVRISETFCDGCKLCTRVCPENSIRMIENSNSRMYAGSFRNGNMVYGRLAPGEENSGKLVSMVREKAKQMAHLHQMHTIIIDGPPGIGCPAISTITGVDHVIIVTEPSMSGLHDLKRTSGITSKFNLKTWVIINKYDLNFDISIQTEHFCQDSSIELAGKLPFDQQVVKAMLQCKSIIEFDPESKISTDIQAIFKKIRKSNH